MGLNDTATAYDPEVPFLRGLLAAEIRKTLTTAGFTIDKARTRGELVFSRRLMRSGNVEVPHTDVVVYTTIEGDEVRQLGKDAIRVAVVYKVDGKPGRGLLKARRVHRTGTIEAIIARMLERMRTAWLEAKQVECCKKCNTPCFVSKAGNTVCAAICFAKQAAS